MILEKMDPKLEIVAAGYHVVMACTVTAEQMDLPFGAPKITTTYTLETSPSDSLTCGFIFKLAKEMAENHGVEIKDVNVSFEPKEAEEEDEGDD